MFDDPWQQQRLLIVVKTYPTPAWKGVEVSCTAALTERGQWIRLFPIPFRLLGAAQQFKKYQWIEAKIRPASSDVRPESFTVDTTSIKVVSLELSKAQAWRARKDAVLPLQAHCLCCLEEYRKAHKKTAPTLGIVKPKVVTRLQIVPEHSPEWTIDELERLQQGGMFEQGPKRPLEKIPYKFIYHFKCDEVSCTGHRLSCTDWEMGQSFRAWRDKYGSDWEHAFRRKYEQQLPHERDIYFYVGTVHQHPNRWIIVGLFYPPLGNARPTQVRTPQLL